MARRDGWSRTVTLIKIILPLTALTILSLLFLLSRKVDAVFDLSESPDAPGQTLNEPRFSGTAKDGSQITASARRAYPAAGNPKAIGADGLRLDIALKDGSSVAIAAPVGVIDSEAREMRFQGGVVLTSSQGYEIRSADVLVGYDEPRFATGTTIDATAPMGTITADGLRLDAGTAKDEFLLVFTGHVRLVYDPKETR